MNNRLALYVCVALSLLSSPARADWGQQDATLSCNVTANAFIIAFGPVWNGSEDERAALAAKNNSNGYTYFPDNQCQLGNGDKVSLSLRLGQFFANGRGGGDPSGFLTLSINTHYIYYEYEHYSGYGAGFSNISLIKYENGSLEETGKNRTTDQTARLAGNHFSEQEAASFWNVRRRESYRSRLPSECSDMDFSALLDTVKFSPVENQPLRALYFNTKSTSIDLDNDGQTETVYSLGQRTHYFYGSTLVSFFASADAEQKFLSPGILDKLDIDPVGIHALNSLNAYSIALNAGTESARYQFNAPFILDEKTYVVSWTHNHDDIPAATVSFINPDKSVSIICNFPSIPKELERHE